MTRRIRQLAARAADETGLALPVAAAVLVITLLLAGVAVAVAINNSSLSNRDTNSSSAIAAADAGARAALYRLNMFTPGDSYCPDPADDAVGTNGAPTSTLCAPQTGSLGNGATYQYWISGGIQNGVPACTGNTVNASASLGPVSQRCITAVGTANGVSARLQERVAAYDSAPVFPTAIFGTKSVTVNSNETITTDTPAFPALLGTNGVLTVAGSTGGGTTLIDGYQLPPGATVAMGQNVTNVGPTAPIGAPYPTPTPINNLGTDQNTASGGNCATNTAAPFTNCDYRISCAIQIPLQCDPHTGTVDYDPVNRTLYLGNNATLVLTGGYYNFCSLYLSNNSVISLAYGVSTQFYIDSPADPNSGVTGSASNPPCPNANSDRGIAPGTFSMQNSATLNAGGSALNAKIFVYGDPSDTPPTNQVILNNVGSSSYALDAPFSNVILKPSNNTIFKGAIAGYSVTLGNVSHFIYEADGRTIESSSPEQFFRAYWAQCPAKSTSSTDPTAGC